MSHSIIIPQCPQTRTGPTSPGTLSPARGHLDGDTVSLVCVSCVDKPSYSGVTLPSFHSIRILPRCKVGEECGRRMACWVSGALSLGAGDPGTLISGLGVYDLRIHTTFLLLAQRDGEGSERRKTMVGSAGDLVLGDGRGTSTTGDVPVTAIIPSTARTQQGHNSTGSNAQRRSSQVQPPPRQSELAFLGAEPRLAARVLRCLPGAGAVPFGPADAGLQVDAFVLLPRGRQTLPGVLAAEGLALREPTPFLRHLGVFRPADCTRARDDTVSNREHRDVDPVHVNTARENSVFTSVLGTLGTTTVLRTVRLEDVAHTVTTFLKLPLEKPKRSRQTHGSSLVPMASRPRILQGLPWRILQGLP
ncbi:hypothetical protein EYF80_022788 [Liparis tanakae]|uniref:Uncharacterized protein n=1 Tax=Liparis tanakae TaxID=230148 RepID=A0A4Z2HP22_9TELE|nr:hypothetical protein EYF80_022788 [Liparis tanakae]